MANIPEDVAYVMKIMGIKTWETFKDLMKGPLADQIGGELERYRSGDQGKASSLSVQSEAEGRVRPTEQETFAGRPADFARDDPSNESEDFRATTFASQRRVTEEPTKKAAQEKYTSLYTGNTALQDTEGNLLTETGITNLDDADLTERYKVFFGEAPKDAKTARSEFVDLLKNFSKTTNPLLD